MNAPSRPVMERARVVDDGANLIVLPIIRLGTTEELYLRGADLAIINSGACSLLAQIERMECLEKLSRDIAPAAVSPSPDYSVFRSEGLGRKFRLRWPDMRSWCAIWWRLSPT